ncbi:MAG TPA: hypothetical protein VE444_02610 [Gaiellaceae bacterium]|nr:hypothetical protein [Gaiellaceae bacterium]
MKRVALGACVLVLAGCGGGGEDERLMPPGRTLAATADITPRTSLFGDTLTARVVVSLDRRRVNADDLELNARFTPYERIGDTEVERRDVGSQTQLTYTTRIRCVQFACLPRSGSLGGESRLDFRFKPARVGNLTVRWPPLEVSSRINQSELQAFRYRATLAPLPEAKPRVSPRALAQASLAAAVLLTLLALGLLGRAAVRARRRRPELDLPPVERALLFLEWTRDGEDRRRALELLAEALDAEDRRELGRAARKLAWSDAAPTREEAQELATRVKEVRRAA